MPLILGANSATAGGLTVPNSCRFNTADSANVYWTPGGAGNRRKWTWSGWGKINAVEALTLFSAASGSSYCECSINIAGVMDFLNVNSGVLTGRRQLSQLFRDPSAWMHFCMVWDSDNATALQQMRIYINGTEVTAFALTTNPAGTDSVMNDTVRTNVGSSNGGGPFMAGYLADVCFIDGLALTPTSFGEFDTDTPTVFKPIDVSELTFGTNGFHLDFQDSADLGNDAAGSNNLTSGGLTAADQASDTPSNNFATFNPLYKDTGGPITYSEGNTIATETANSWTSAHSTSGRFGGKFYWECKLSSFSGGSASYMGAATGDYAASKIDSGSFIGQDNASIGYYSADGKVEKGGVASAFGDTWGAGDIIGMALDLANNYAYWSKNGTWQNSGDPTSGSSGTGGVSLPSDMIGGQLILFSISPNESVMQSNFGGSSGFAISSANSDGNGYGNFEYAVPSGYLSLCTRNLGSDGG